MMLEDLIKIIIEKLKDEYGSDFVDVAGSEIYVSDEDSGNGYVIQVDYMT